MFEVYLVPAQRIQLACAQAMVEVIAMPVAPALARRLDQLLDFCRRQVLRGDDPYGASSASNCPFLGGSGVRRRADFWLIV